ncbi:Nuclear export mediator factor Nemf [Cryptosporidium felis]|nr:Nuclear export mediator factor Nemf [Cryptosporidium felis]
MVKSRMTAIDIFAMVHGISKDIKGQKLINIYDVNNRTYLFKFGGEGKKFMVVESGIRFHTTHWKRENEHNTSVSSISFFNSRLRRYLRNKKLVDISQMDMDRIVRLTFGFGDNIFYLILEFFVAGNIILTDSDYKVLVILRETNDLSIGKYYDWKVCEAASSPIRSLASIKVMNSNKLSEPLYWLGNCRDSEYMKDEIRKIVHDFESDELKGKTSSTCKKNKQDETNNTRVTILDVFSRILKSFNLPILEKLLESENIDGKEEFNIAAIDEYSIGFSNCISKALDALSTIQSSEAKGTLIVSLASENDILSDDIVLQKRSFGAEQVESQKSEEKVYISYSPYIENHTWISATQGIPKDAIVVSRIVGRFCECVDEFYSSIDIGKEMKVVAQEQKSINSKVDKVRIDQERRLEGLLSEREACLIRAKAMEFHQETLDKILQLIRHLVATGAQWQDIWNEIQQQKKNNHPLAKFIKSLDFQEDKVKIKFSPEDLSSEIITNYEQKKKGIEFDLFISKSIQSNIRHQYNESKFLAKKVEKTQHAYKLALNKVTKIAKKDAEKASKGLNSNIPRIKKLRVQYWFEKFHWFVSSDGYLIIGGHDASQNELLFRRYLEKNDRYIHADIHGATTCIVKNPSNISEIPLNTLSEAGQMSICYSKAWMNKTVISAWWVYPDQVSKTAPSGEYLTTGSFIIRGKKNFLPPLKLEMGCALYFIKNKDKSRHIENVEGDKMILLETQPSVGPDNIQFETLRIDSGTSEPQINIDSGDDADEESENEPSATEEVPNRHAHSNSVHVRFSVGDVSDIIPPMKIEHRVQFDELPPELLLSRPFNPLSIDEMSNQTSPVNSIESISKLASGVTIESSSSDNEDNDNTEANSLNSANSNVCDNKGLRVETVSTNYLNAPKTSSRRSSVDEGPPPVGFSTSTLPTPAELLSHKVEFPVLFSSSSSEEVIESNKILSNKLKESSTESGAKFETNTPKKNCVDDQEQLSIKAELEKCTKDANTHEKFNDKLRENYRRRSIDGGPTPRGFIPDHVPSARELLQKIRFDPVDLELEHLSHMRERGRFISDAVPYLPEELQRLIMVSNQNSNKKHRFTIDTNADLYSRIDLKDSPALGFGNNRIQFSTESVGDRNIDEKSNIKATDGNSQNIIFGDINSKKETSDKVEEKKVNNTLSRRRKSKLKKVAEKYGDQDQEEKEIKMMLSGSKEMKKSSEGDIGKEAGKGYFSAAIKSKPLHISQQEKRKKEQDRMERIYKDRVVDNTIENREFQAIKEYMLRTNKYEDPDIIAVIPIFAPFACIKDFDFCVKLTPGGSTKRSKAAHDIIHHFSSISYKEKDKYPNSYEYVKALRIDDLIKNLMNPVKVQFALEKRQKQVEDSH